MPKKNSNAPLLLLDTHIWIWLINGAAELADAPELSVITASAKNNSVNISAISIWEFGMLEAKGKIKLSINCTDWVKAALQAPGISWVPLEPDILIESSRLPGAFHGDPADRMIVATARKLDAVLVTKDRQILNYGKDGYVKLLG